MPGGNPGVSILGATGSRLSNSPMLLTCPMVQNERRSWFRGPGAFMFMAIEICLAAICVPLAMMGPHLGEGWFGRVERRISTFAQRRVLAFVSVGLLALGLRLSLLPILPIPQPKVSDEFSYLLQSDTFSHGRLANPTHPMWVHFETLQENWQPTYASMYYPGYAAFLAFGQVVMHHPFWGVWLSSGLMCAAICWALQGWMSPGWALIGALLAVIRLGSFSYWDDSYWGGTVAALAGALILGGFARIRKDPRIRDSLLLALGMSLLAYTRPYEGLFFCLPILIALIVWARQSAVSARQIGASVVLPFVLVMAIGFVALGFYFYRVTGSAFTTTYQVNMRAYGLVYFPWQHHRTITFRHPELAAAYGGSVVGSIAMARHMLMLQFVKPFVIWLFYFGPVLTLPWLAWLFTRPHNGFFRSFSPELRFLLLLCAVTYFSCMLTIYIGQPHYVAHLAVVFYAILLLMLRDLHDSGNASLKFLARAIPAVCFLLLTLRVVAPFVHLEPKPSWIRTWCSQDEQNIERARVLDRLERTSGKHLVIVHYQPNHDFILDEWVYNGADIDGSKVIWARDMGSQNAELTRYFSDRQIWLAEPDYNPAKLTPYAP